MKTLNFLLTLFFCNIQVLSFSQSININSFSDNPVEFHPLVGGNLTINYEYTTEVGSIGNSIYIGLEILDENNEYQRTVTELTLENQEAGIDIKKSVRFFITSNNTLTSELPSGFYYQLKAVLYASGTWNEISSAGYWNVPRLTLQNTSGIELSTNKIQKGADVSWMTEMQSDGFIWKNNLGESKDLLPLLKEYQLDAVRLRVWVNPEKSDANGWCDIHDLVAKAKLAHSEDMDILISIHYSDYWADPGKQNKPITWQGFSIAELEVAVYNHTEAILLALDAEGIMPKWVQIGNETNDGMLWDSGKASSSGFSNYAKFLNAGSMAVKAFSSEIKTVLHLANGDNNSLFRWNIDGLLSNGFLIDSFDIIGLSLYPNEDNWISKVEETYDNMTDLISRYEKDVMMVEVGFPNNKPAEAYQFLTYIIEKTKQAQGLGVFYWEPIAHKNWKEYQKGAWDEDGSPSEAMDAFLDESPLSLISLENENNALLYPNPSSDFVTISMTDKIIKKVSIFDITGRLVVTTSKNKSIELISVNNLKKGVYFIQVNNLLPLKFIKN